VKNAAIAPISTCCSTPCRAHRLELDLKNRLLYWTDRGDPPRGNTVNRARWTRRPKAPGPEILYQHLMEGIGIAIDFKDGRISSPTWPARSIPRA